MEASDDIPNVHKVYGQHVYEGLILSGFSPRGHLEKVKDMEIFDDDVIISTYPRSGTTLLKEIAWLIIHDADVEAAKQIVNFKRVPHIEHAHTDLFDYDGMADAKHIPRPRLLTTHLPERLLPDQARHKRVKQITIFRNPKDVMVSSFHYYKISAWGGFFTGNWDEFFEMAMAGKLGRGNVLDHVAGWWARRHDPNVLILFYEDLIRHRNKEVMKIAGFLEKSLSVEDIDKIVEATDFKNMKWNPMTNGSRMPSAILDTTKSSFIRKGTVGDWKHYFTINQNRRFDEMIEKKIGGLGINYTYE